MSWLPEAFRPLIFRLKTQRQKLQLPSETPPRIIVSNSTPLIAFARIGELVLLQRIVGQVLIPEAVWQEITRANNRLGAAEIRTASWVEVRAVRTNPPELFLLLDRGEAETIVLAEEIVADDLLLDERAARSVALARGLRIIRTAGLLVRAKRRGVISRVRPFLERMQEQGIHYSGQFLEAFLQQLNE